MNKVTYEMLRNEKITGKLDWLIIGNKSPLSKSLDEFDIIDNLVIIYFDDNPEEDISYKNVNNVFKYCVNYNNSGVDYGIVSDYICKLNISTDNFICIDSTCMILPVYAYIYAYLRDIINCKKVWFLYHEAKVYKNPRSYNYHNGTIITKQLECFRQTDIKGDELIIYLIGFEGMLTMAIDREREPAKKIIINGFPSYLISYKDVSILNNTHLYSNNFCIDYCTASNPFQTFNKLLSIYKRYHDKYQITIATCGSTPSSIGALMFAASIDDVNIITARPENYCFEKREYKNRWIYKSYH